MHFSYFPTNAPLNPSKIDNCWMIINIIVKISKRMYLIEKRTLVLAYRSLPKPSKKEHTFGHFPKDIL